MRVLKGPLALSLIAVSILYWSIAPLFQARYAIEFMDGIVISTSLTVLVIYGDRFIKGLINNNPDIADLIMCGIAGGWLINSLDRQWRLYARVTGSWWMFDHHIIGYMLALLAMFACFHLVGRGASVDTFDQRAKITAEAWSVILIAMVGGAALGALAVALDRAFLGD